MKNDKLTEILAGSFSAEPNFRLPADFAQKVTASVVRREQWKTDLQEYLYLTAILIGVVAAISGIYYLLDKALLIRTVNFFVSNWLPLVFLIFTVNFILFVDKVLLRLLFSRWKTE
jgi:hypothetical protein